MEIRFTAIDEDQGIELAIIAGEIELLESRRSVVVMFIGRAPVVARRRRRLLLRLSQALDRQGVGLNRRLQGLDGGGQVVQGGLEVGTRVTHGGEAERG